LDKLTKGNASSGYQDCLTKQGGKIPMRIETKGSALLKHYTISVPGEIFVALYPSFVLATTVKMN